MSMYRPLLLAICWSISSLLFAQVSPSQLDALNQSYEKLKEREKALLAEIEEVKLDLLRQDLHRNGLPAIQAGEKIIHHSALSLVYDESHEQAKWVAHIITKDIRTGKEARSNDFREDPKVVTGSAVEEDYFLKFLQADNSYTYDGYGYDRGHLAPSADFRWSAKALSESYFYSNMSPQAPEFNRGKWAELEGFIRSYLYRNTETQLYVVTGPVLREDLPKVSRSVNGVSLPKLYFKAVVDLKNERAIGFI
ncbi:MAG: DNA/RNA non-specific endonuclease, partial [Bacteroidota bacterium]